MTPMTTPDDGREVVEIVAHAVCPFTDALDGACMRCKLDERGPNGGVRGCMYVNAAAARAILTAIESSGKWKIVPVEPWPYPNFTPDQIDDVALSSDSISIAMAEAVLEATKRARLLSASPKVTT